MLLGTVQIPRDSGLGRASLPRYLFDLLPFDTNIISDVTNVKVSDVIRYPSLDNELEKHLYPDKAKLYPDKTKLYPDIKAKLYPERHQTPQWFSKQT